jgi:hypothetical protein
MESKDIIIIIFVILYILFFVVTDLNHRFFIIIVIIIVVYMYLRTLRTKKVKNTDIDLFFRNVEKELEVEYEVPENKIFYIHKTPKNLKFIKKTEEYKNVLYDIKFLQIYDRALFNKLVTYIEYFLKIHYKMMLGYYEFNLYYQTLRDTRSEILNIMKTSYFNLPNVSTIMSIPDINVYMEGKIRIVQAITYRYMKIVCQKHNKSFKPPNEYDISKDNKYALF